ncbi:hypothetical protein [Streptomyces collinus]|uniref:hypothetical protein n=1 Tax=Streptomyces collinus TaxID=42684 RepID=UPI0036E73956
MASDPTAPAGEADRAIDSVSALGEDSRRRMFAFIRRTGRAVTRDEAAGVGISRKLAAFHLDKLVDAGLLRTRYASPGGIRQVGRKPKVYEPTDARITVSIPERRRGLLADLLLEAVLTEGADESAVQAAVRSAEHRGRQLGEATREAARPGRLGPNGTDHIAAVHDDAVHDAAMHDVAMHENVDHDDVDHDDAMAQGR